METLRTVLTSIAKFGLKAFCFLFLLFIFTVASHETIDMGDHPIIYLGVVIGIPALMTYGITKLVRKVINIFN